MVRKISLLNNPKNKKQAEKIKTAIKDT